MNKLESIKNFVQDDMDGLCSAHDFLHIQRVTDNVSRICSMEGQGNLEIMMPGAFLHEYFDEKFFEESELAGREEKLRDLFESLNISKEDQEKIIYIIKNVGYGKSLERDESFDPSIDFQIVEDADRLEAIGLIAIARMFSYGGKKGSPIYDPEILPVSVTDDAHYRANASTSTSFNHLYEKLFLLKDLMHTKSGKKLAIPRHEAMEEYAKVFLQEWNGER